MKETVEILNIEELKELINAADDRTAITVHLTGDGKKDEETDGKQGYT